MNEAVVNLVKERGFEINDSLSEYIEIWKSWYQGEVEGFHNYKVYNGKDFSELTRASLQLGKTMTEQIANLLFNEKCSIVVANESSQEFLEKVFDHNNMYIKLNESQEKKSAFGTMCYIPYFAIDTIKMNYVSAENLIPLSWENGVINELAVYSRVWSEGEEYIFVQLFTVQENSREYQIENLLLKDDDIVPLSDVAGFSDVEETVHTGSESKPFVIDRLNIANNIDPENPLGIAIFANAIDSMRFVDIVWDSYLNEFVLGKKRVMVSSEATDMRDGQPVFDPNDLVYYQLPEGLNLDGHPFIHEINMTLRSADHQQALQQALNTFSSQCGLGENFFRYQSGSLATATQVMSENNTMFRTLKKHEIVLEAALVDLVRLILEIGQRHNLHPGLDLEAKITVTFDDSIIENKDVELARRMQEVAAGLIRPELYLAYRYGVTEEQAKEMMPGMGTLVPDDEIDEKE